MEISKQDIFTPANAVTIVGGALAVHGATHIHELSGVLEFGAGRMLDICDGFIARRTHSSPFGEGLDATVDKAAIAAGVGEAWHQNAVPWEVLAVIALINITNASANLYAKRQGAEPHSSWAGKRYTFGQNAAYGAFALSHALHHNPGWEAAGWGLFGASTPIAIKSSIDYGRGAWQARQLPRQKSQTNKNPKTSRHRY